MRSPYVIAFLNPLNLAMLALAVAAGLCAAWWMFPLGLILWGVLWVSSARQPSLRVALKDEARTGALSARFQTVFDDARKAQVRLLNALAASDGARQGALEPVRAAVEALTDEIYTVCERSTAAENFARVGTSGDQLKQERALAVLELESTADLALKAEKQQALAALDGRIASLQAMDSTLKRIETQCRAATNDLNAVLADVLRVHASGGQQATGTVGALVQRLEAQRKELVMLEDITTR